MVAWFAIPAAVAAFAGALLLNRLSGSTEIFSYHLGGRLMQATEGILILALALLLGSGFI